MRPSHNRGSIFNDRRVSDDSNSVAGVSRNQTPFEIDPNNGNLPFRAIECGTEQLKFEI